MSEPFRFHSGQVAHSAKDLIGVCHQSPQEVIYHLKRGDFENWLAYIGETEIAEKVAQVRQNSVSDEEKLQQFLDILQPPEPKIVTPTSVQEETTSPSTPSIAPPSSTTATPEVEETTSITSEIEETTATPEVEETTSITSEIEETTATPEVEETTATPEVEETTSITSEIEETTATPEVEETTSKVTETEDKSSTEINSSLSQETETEKVKPIAPPNEYPDEMPIPNSAFAKAMTDFVNRYISEQ